MIRVDVQGRVTEGHPLHVAEFAIHLHGHAARPKVNAALHMHPPHGCDWSSLGELFDPIAQDACTFHGDPAEYNDFDGAVVELDEGERIARAVGRGPQDSRHPERLRRLGMEHSMVSAALWMILLECCCRVHLMAEAAVAQTVQALHLISREIWKIYGQIYHWVGSRYEDRLDFRPLFEQIVDEHSDLLD